MTILFVLILKTTKSLNMPVFEKNNSYIPVFGKNKSNNEVSEFNVDNSDNKPFHY